MDAACSRRMYGKVRGRADVCAAIIQRCDRSGYKTAELSAEHAVDGLMGMGSEGDGTADAVREGCTTGSEAASRYPC